MANELTINLPSITYVKPPFNENLTPGILQVSVTGKQVVHGSVALSTVDTNLNKGNVGTPGFCVFHNQDNSIAIQIGSDGTLYPNAVNGSEWGVIRWNAASVHAKSASGTPILEYWIVEA